MISSLDGLVIMFMGIVGIALLSLILTYVVRKPAVKKVGFYILLVLAILVGIIGLRIGFLGFATQTIVGIAVILAAIGAFILERKGKEFLYAQILASVAVILGIVNLYF